MVSTLVVTRQEQEVAPSDAAHSRRADQITEALKRYVLTNGLKPGTRLPPERRLAEVLMVGRNAVREALQSLAGMGIVEQRHGSGIYVRDFDPERLAEQLSYGLREDGEYWRHLLEARVEVETVIAALVAKRITGDETERLSALMEAMRRQTGHEQSIIRTDLAFHLELAARMDNPVLERLARTVITEYFRYAASLRLGHSLVGSPTSVQNHEPLLAALAAHDPDAAANAMRYHFRDLRGYVDEVLSAAARP